MLADAVS